MKIGKLNMTGSSTTLSIAQQKVFNCILNQAGHQTTWLKSEFKK